MALTKCKECGNEISTTATACPKCGAKVVRTSVFTKVIAGFCVLVGISMCTTYNRVNEAQEQRAAAEAKRTASLTAEQKVAEAKKAAERKAEKDLEEVKEEAALACRRFVTKTLKDPDSAKWESPWYSDAIISKGGVFDVQVQVRAKNSFGAYGLSRMHCTMTRGGGSWTASKVTEIR